jgi:hypothetical protein
LLIVGPSRAVRTPQPSPVFLAHEHHLAVRGVDLVAAEAVVVVRLDSRLGDRRQALLDPVG